MNENGQLILETLKSYKSPVTALIIAKKLAYTVGADVEEVKHIVHQTLEGGVQFGYVQRANNKYFAKSVDLNEEFPTDDDGEVVSPTNTMQDRPRRRSRMRSGSRTRKRSGSRRRRRSSSRGRRR